MVSMKVDALASPNSFPLTKCFTHCRLSPPRMSVTQHRVASGGIVPRNGERGWVFLEALRTRVGRAATAASGSRGR